MRRWVSSCVADLLYACGFSAEFTSGVCVSILCARPALIFRAILCRLNSLIHSLLHWIIGHLRAQVVLSRVGAGGDRCDLAAFERARTALFDPSTPNKYARLIVSEHTDMVTALPVRDSQRSVISPRSHTEHGSMPWSLLIVHVCSHFELEYSSSGRGAGHAPAQHAKPRRRWR